MEPSDYPCGCCDSDWDFYIREAKLRSQINELIDTVFEVVEEIRLEGGTPYLKALQHCLVHVANDGKIETFKPLVRTLDYAGIDRRKSPEKNKVH